MKLSLPVTAILLLHVPRLTNANLEPFEFYSLPDASVSKIDLDVRSLLSKLSLASEEALKDAIPTYQTPTQAALSLQDLAIGDNEFRDFDLYEAFLEFYGDDSDFADDWMFAAFEAKDYVLDDEKQINFSKLDAEGRSTAIRWGAITLNIFMGVISRLYDAIDTCDDSTEATIVASKEDAIRKWDEAFALYTGSLAEAENPIGGYLLYNFVQVRSQNFGTCKIGEESPINKKLVRDFIKGKALLQDGDCSDLNHYAKNIQAHLTVPIIQASLEVMHAVDLGDNLSNVIQGEAAAFSAALAPIISACRRERAYNIYIDMFPGNVKVHGSFEGLKHNVESSYDCLGITCADVGGLLNYNGEYVSRGEACDGVQPVIGAGVNPSQGSSGSSGPVTEKITEVVKSRNNGKGVAFGIILAFLSGIAGGYLLYRKRMKGADKSIEDASVDKSGAPEGDGDLELSKTVEDVEIV